MPKRPPDRLNTEELERIKTLRASGLTYNAIAKRTGRDGKTIKKACLQPEVASGIEVMKEKLANYFENLACRLLTSIKDEDIERINTYQRVVSAGISIDKMRLLREQSTANVSLVALLDKVHRDERKGLKKGEQAG